MKLLALAEDWGFDNPCNKSSVLKGVTKFPHPDSIFKFLICDASGKTFSAQCPKEEVFHADCSSCALPNQTFSKSCTISNEMFRKPCSKENIIAGNLTFPHPNSTNKYIRCDSRGNAWEEECFSGSFWDQTKMICVLPEAFNPCHRRDSIVQTLYPHYCNPRLYVQCDNNGHPLVHMCQKDYVFLNNDLTCSPPGFPGTEYLRYTCN
ncbi:uncharacterized protein LOC132752360 [Ruditapes philippinarum]|uniref:uncharacterized protein LOC132752360 n=1 Tax=Ruditapes philippinarum TaxID=129788 RepID=UPI00295B4153|nr:uncharacterized protein LOC132752360 [Ruditapes philippinarum]